MNRSRQPGESAAQRDPTARLILRTLPELQAQLDAFRAHYNERRPHHALGRSTSRTPAAAYTPRPKATPTGSQPGQGSNLRPG
jgi:transposase InsO family protein